MGAGSVLTTGPVFLGQRNMYTTICTFETLLAAYYKARSCKRYKSTILKFGFYLENNLFRLQKDLMNETYLPSAYVCFTVHDPKERKVAAPHFRDRVCQHALISAIDPLFEKTFIYDSYACREQKGTHFGLSRIKKFLQAARSFYGPEAEVYYLSMDISKFFASMSWDILLSLIFRKVSCPKTKKLIEKIVTHYQFFNEKGQPFNPAPIVLTPWEQKGLPIGNLTSQLFANVYLNELDQFVKHTLRLRWYGRYMDDFIFIHKDKEYLHRIKDTVREFLQDKLKLTLSERKIIIANVTNGVPFVGYRIFYDHVLVRGKTLLHMQRRFKKRKKRRTYGKITEEQLKSSINSFLGHFQHANAWKLKQRMFTLNERYSRKKKYSNKPNIFWDKDELGL